MVRLGVGSFAGAYEYTSIATLRCHIGYQRVPWQGKHGNDLEFLLSRFGSFVAMFRSPHTHTPRRCSSLFGSNPHGIVGAADALHLV